ncbi:hypothetical protein LJC58_00700 [Lachnospiraceae bacterium OttesenSCG-928-D06]|nr:hypothetical protein [Lachnospiraceae bacterium OttesenSCG-928-D06]
MEKIIEEKWSEIEFKNPPAKFRGAPFWAWNNRLDVEQLKRQVGYFKEMGMGGYHIHCRVGLDTEYLGKDFMECVKACAEEGKKQGLYTYLYDEDRWPSGSAGGLVTKEAAYRSRFLRFVPVGEQEGEDRGEGKLLASYRIQLDNGYLVSYEQVSEEEKGQDIWRLYLEIAKPDPWHNNQTYVDTLNKKAIERFIQITHEAYEKVLGSEFGKSIPSIFTDEPQFRRKETLDFAEEKKSLILPYTEGFEEFYGERYGEEFLESFPEVVWELKADTVSKARYQYHDGIAELFAKSFSDVLGNWCQEHNLMLTGHMMEEPSLLSQTSALGDAMRSYRSFHEPGIDMLCDWREYTTAKQAQSAARQFARSGVLSELYGVTNWDFDFRGHKLQGDWQAALGITRRVHHLSWVSMEGEAKRDYPASIFYQSPWYQEYKIVEDHFARINTALMRGKAHVRVAVIHPVESYWLHFGPKEQTARIREALEQDFSNITEWLLFGMIDFDYLAESLLPDQNVYGKDGKLYVGDMAYEAVIVPGCETLRSSTIKYLSEFKKEKGRLIFAGELPKYVDAKTSERGKVLAEKSIKIPMNQIAVLTVLESLREIEIRRPEGQTSDQFIYQMRNEGDYRWLFVANGKKPKTQDIPQGIEYQIKIRGNFAVTVCDTQSGKLNKIPSSKKDGWTVIVWKMDMHDSLLLRMEGEGGDICLEDEISETKETRNKIDKQRMMQPESFELSEPNVLLLDQCMYRFNGGQWQEKEEILRIDDKLRGELGYAKRKEAMPQPWICHDEEDEIHAIELLFTIMSEVECKNTELALEGMEQAEVYWNENKVAPEVCGWFVDESIKKRKLGDVKSGENQLRIKLPFGRKTNLEWCYLLGHFGVRTMGRETKLIPFPKKLLFGDYVVQGLPFYAGNVTYEVLLPSEGGDYKLQVSKFRAPLLKVSVDGGEWKPIAYSPYEVDLGYLEPGVHKVRITSFGNRVNAFGTVHNCDETTEWFGPNEWITQDERYSYEYQLKRMGILATPVYYR